MKIKTKISAFSGAVKTKFNINIFNKILFLFIIVLGVSYVVTVNDLIVKGFELQELKTQAYELGESSRQNRIKAMAMESYGSLSQKADEMNMVAVGNEIDYITIIPSVVAQK